VSHVIAGFKARATRAGRGEEVGQGFSPAAAGNR